MKSLPSPLVLLCLLLVSCFGCATRAQAQWLKAQVTSPVNGSTLESTALNLAWNAGLNIEGYALWVGTQPGGYDLFADTFSPALRTKALVVPPDRKIYVRLYSMIGGAYQQFNDYFFLAPASVKAVFDSPLLADGAVLSSSTVNLQWTAGTGVTGYAIWVGSGYGKHDLGAYSLADTVRTKTITVPVDGGPVYVALWSLINGTYQAVQYCWQTAQPSSGPMPARLTSPVNGSTLTSRTLTLNWDAGAQVSSYALWVGKTPGGYDLYAGNEGVNRSKTLTNMPTDGSRVYVTLHSLIGGIYQSNEYSFNTRTDSLSEPAVVTSPPIGSVLPATSMTVSWSQGLNPSGYGYWLDVVPEAYGLTAGTTTSQSATFANLPRDGRPVYLKLFSYFPNATLSTSAWFLTPNTVAGNKPSLISGPPIGSSLDIAGSSFQWDEGTGVTARALWIGSSPAGYDLFAGDTYGQSSSSTFKAPADGRLIYVRLYSTVTGVAQPVPVDYVYRAPIGGKSEITSPASGALLDGTSASFTWSPGSGVTAYALWVGSTPVGGANTGYDIHASNLEGSVHSSAVPVPNDGRPIYVRLQSKIGDAWQISDHFFQTQARVQGAPQLAITAPTLPAGEKGAVYPNSTFTATGGYGTKTWTLASGTLPPGMSLSEAGVLGGTPSAAGSFSFTVQVADTNGSSATKAASLVIQLPPLVISTSSLSGGVKQVPYQASLVATGGLAPYAWTVLSGSLPSGLNLAPDGVITGTPTAAGTAAFTAKVTDAGGQVTTLPFAIVVVDSGTGGTGSTGSTGGTGGAGGTGGTGNTGGTGSTTTPPVVFTSWRKKSATFHGEKGKRFDQIDDEPGSSITKWVKEVTIQGPTNDGFNGDADEQSNPVDDGDPRDENLANSNHTEQMDAEEGDEGAHLATVDIGGTKKDDTSQAPADYEEGRYKAKNGIGANDGETTSDSSTRQYVLNTMKGQIEGLSWGNSNTHGWRGDGSTGVCAKTGLLSWSDAETQETLTWSYAPGVEINDTFTKYTEDAEAQWYQVRLQSNKAITDPEGARAAFVLIKVTTPLSGGTTSSSGTSASSGGTPATAGAPTTEFLGIVTLIIPKDKQTSTECETTGSADSHVITVGDSKVVELKPASVTKNQKVEELLLPVEVNSMDRYLAGSLPDSTIDALGGNEKFGLVFRNTASGEEYRFNKISEAHVYDNPLMSSSEEEDKFLSNSEISAWANGPNSSTKELTQEVVFYRQDGSLHFRGLFDEAGQIEIGLLKDGAEVGKITHTLTPDPDIGNLLETVDSILAGTWDDPGGIILAAMQQGVSGDDLEALRNAASQAAAASFGDQSDAGGFTGFLRRNLTIKVNIPTWKAVKDKFANGVRAAGETAARAVKVVAFTGKGFVEGAWMGVKDDATSLVELGKMIINPAETAKTFYEGFKVLIDLDMEGWKNVGKTLVKSFLEKGDEGVGEWAEPNNLDVAAYLVGFTAGFITEQIVVTYVTAGIVKAGNIGAKIGQFLRRAASGLATALEGAAQAVRTLMMKSKNSLFRRFSQDVLSAEDVKTLKRLLQELELACPL